jgi:predicted phage tail protein
MEDRRPPGERQRLRPFEIYWMTVSYRTLAVWLFILLLLVAFVVTLLSPGTMTKLIQRAANWSAEQAAAPPPELTQARFVNIDGTVRVKKADAVEWVTANLRMGLDRGDLIQTGSEGVARITFMDGTTYVIKPETLIVVEENMATPSRATTVAVRVNSGNVDLSTGTWDIPGSLSKVSFENATATMRENTRASVKNDPTSNVHEITVAQGSAQLQRGSEMVSLTQYEKASFAANQAPLVKERVISPPRLEQPLNLEPIIVRDVKRAPIRFAWSTVPEAVSYRLRVSTSPLFVNPVVDRKLSSTEYSITGLEQGTYYWVVAAMDRNGRESQDSDMNKFSLVAQPETEQMLLAIDNIFLHGNVVEVSGRTEPTATVIINNEPVVNIGADGHFKHFTAPLPRGVNTITVTAQNRRGDVVTRKATMVVP